MQAATVPANCTLSTTQSTHIHRGNSTHTQPWNQRSTQTPPCSVTHISPKVDVSLGLQQHSNNSTVTILTGKIQCCASILYRHIQLITDRQAVKSHLRLNVNLSLKCNQQFHCPNMTILSSYYQCSASILYMQS